MESSFHPVQATREDTPGVLMCRSSTLFRFALLLLFFKTTILFCSSTLSSVRQRTPKQRSKAASHTDLQLGGTPEDLDQDGDGDGDDGTLEDLDRQHGPGDE